MRDWLESIAWRRKLLATGFIYLAWVVLVPRMTSGRDWRLDLAATLFACAGRCWFTW